MKFYTFFLFVALIILTGCHTVKTEELTTQPREYVEETTEHKEESVEENILADKAEDRFDSFINKYNDINFNEDIIHNADEDMVSYLTLKSRYIDSSEIKYNEGGIDEKCPFYIRINHANMVKGKENLSEYFKNCKELNDIDYKNYIGEDKINNGSYLIVNLTIRNDSKENREIDMMDRNIEAVYGDVGIYRISEEIGDYVTTDYEGDNRGEDKANEILDFKSGEELTMNLLFLITEKPDSYDITKLYFNVNNIYRSGELYDDGSWHADSEGAPNILKLEVRDDD